MGFDLTVLGGVRPIPEPEELFFDLAKAGVVFLNASYVPPGEGGFNKDARQRAFGINRLFLEVARHVICCGKAKTPQGSWPWLL